MSIKTKKRLTKVASVATSVATILWLSGISMLAPVAAATYADGTLLKGSAATIWAVNNNLKVEIRSADVFNNSGYSWSAIKTVSDAALNSVANAALIKTATNPDVYKLEKNFKRKLASIEIFNSYSLDWGKISVVSQPAMDSFSYAPIYQHNANLYWRNDDGSNRLHLFPNMDLFTSNGYQTRDLIVVNDSEFGSFAIGGNISSAPTPTTGVLTVALASDTPASGTLANDTSSGSAVADLAHFVFNNTSGTAVKVTQLKVKRLGVSGDTTLSNVYLFDGYTRLTDEATLSSGVASFNDAAGIFTVPANSSKTVAVRTDIAAAMSGQTVGFALNAAADIVSDASSVSGSFPLSGNLMSIVDSTSVATATWGAVTPGINLALDAQNDFTAWSASLTINNQDIKMEMIRFTQIGSISAGDFNNIKLKVNNVETATGQLVTGKTGQDLIFDLHNNPYAITKGNARTISIVGDIVGGTNKTMTFRIEKKADVMLKDQGYGNYTILSGTAPYAAGQQTISTGTITMTKQAASPSGNVTASSTNISLAKFDVKANGEEIKINTLKVQAYMAATTTTISRIKNVALYLDGVQVGNTTNLAVTAGASNTTVYTSFNIYQKIPAATTKVLEVKGDIYGCPTTACAVNSINANDTIQIKVLGSASEDNAQGMISLQLVDAPGSTASANALTVGAGALTLAKNTSYSDQTVAAGSNIKIGSYNIQANANDVINVTGFTVALNNVTLTAASWSNMYVMYGSSQTSTKGTVTSSNTFSVNTTLSASQQMQIDIWATLASSATSGSASTTLAVTATKAVDGSDASASATVGQTITVTTASRSVGIDTVIPSALVVGGTSGVNVMDVRFKSLSAVSTIDKMRVKYVVTGDADADAITACKLNYPIDGGTADTAYISPVYDGSVYYFTFTGMTMYLPANLEKTVKVYCNFNYVGTGFADTGDYPAVDVFDYDVTSGGSKTIGEAASTDNSQVMVLRGSKPTIAKLALPSLVLAANTALTIAKFTVTPTGAIGWKNMVFVYATTTNVAMTSADIIDEDTGTVVDAATISYSAKTLTFIPSTEQVVSGSAKTYRVDANISGSIATTDSMQVYIQNANSADTAPLTGSSSGDMLDSPSITWTDRSNDSHSTTTSDWTNDWLVKNIGSGYGWALD